MAFPQIANPVTSGDSKPSSHKGSPDRAPLPSCCPSPPSPHSSTDRDRASPNSNGLSLALSPAVSVDLPWSAQQVSRGHSAYGGVLPRTQPLPLKMLTELTTKPSVSLASVKPPDCPVIKPPLINCVMLRGTFMKLSTPLCSVPGTWV